MLPYLIFLLNTYQISSKCSFTQDCEGQDCNLLQPLVPFSDPQLHEYTQELMCPEYLHMATCCNNFQNNKMTELYKLIDMTLGHFAGGCDICAANMKKLWCHIVCSPEQSSFVAAYKTETKEDSYSDLLNIDCNLQEKTARDIFTSCKDSPHIQNLGVRTYADFFSFLGDKSVVVSHAITRFKYSDSGLKLDLAKCTAEETQLYGYNVEPCQCLK